jgi:hypothetical protein
MKNRTFHSDFLKRRKEWFSAYATAHTAMWWILAGHLPTVKRQHYSKGTNDHLLFIIEPHFFV